MAYEFDFIEDINIYKNFNANQKETAYATNLL